MIKTIRNAVNNSNIESEELFLITKINDFTGFFIHRGKLIYLVKNIEHLSTNNIETEFLIFNSNIYVQSVKNHSTFQSGYYNIIKYKGSINDDNIDSFVNLCMAHSSSNIRINLDKFFYSLITLFQLPKEQQYKNLIGLFGELKFIEHIYSKYNKKIATFWHTSGSLDKYDIVCPNNNFEIKTIKSEEKIVKIKHSQLYNCDINKNYLVLIQIEENNAGETLNEFINKIRKISVFSESYNFQLNIEKERKRVSPIDANSLKFKLVNVQIYPISNLDSIKGIPDNITNIEYNYNLGNIKSCTITSSIFE